MSFFTLKSEPAPVAELSVSCSSPRPAFRGFEHILSPRKVIIHIAV